MIALLSEVAAEAVLKGSKSRAGRKMKGDRTLAELAQQYDIHPDQIIGWKRQLLEGAAQVGGGPKPEVGQGLKELHAKIGELTLENDLLAGALSKPGRLSAKR